MRGQTTCEHQPTRVTPWISGLQVKVAVARKADALIEAGGEGGERLRLHRMPLDRFSTVYSFYAVLAGYEGFLCKKWKLLSTKAAEDEVLSLRDEMGWTVLHWAAADDSRAKLAGVIAARVAGLVNSTDKGGNTPLHLAAMAGSEAVTPALLAAGADTNAKNVHGQTPLRLAQKRGHAAVVAVLS